MFRVHGIIGEDTLVWGQVRVICFCVVDSVYDQFCMLHVPSRQPLLGMHRMHLPSSNGHIGSCCNLGMYVPEQPVLSSAGFT